MSFGNFGFMEILLILVVVLLLFGAKRLPEIGSSFGKSISSFKRALNETNEAIREEVRQPLPPPAAESMRSSAADEEREPKRLIS